MVHKYLYFRTIKIIFVKDLFINYGIDGNKRSNLKNQTNYDWVLLPISFEIKCLSVGFST